MRLTVGNRAETIQSLKDHDIDVALMGRPPPGVPALPSCSGIILW